MVEKNEQPKFTLKIPSYYYHSEKTLRLNRYNR